VVTSLLRDQRMREQAHVIQEEVAKMMDDVGRLDDRVKRLQTHFAQANKDVDEILVSTKRVTARGGRIAQVEVGDAAAPASTPVRQQRAPVQRQAPPRGPELPFEAAE
jgi:DNA recombination protein RmuC